MAMNYPKGSSFTPFFYNLGYRLQYIGLSIPVSSQKKEILSQYINSNINSVVTPEMIYRQENTNNYLLIECKLIDIVAKLDTRDSRQALGYLSLTDNELITYLGSLNNKKVTGMLEYSVLDEHIHSYNNNLKILSDVVDRAIGDHFPYRISSLKFEGSIIYYTYTLNGKKESIKITSDPLLLLIPLDPDVNLKDEYGKKVLEENLRMTVANKICPFIGIMEFSFNLEEVCEEVIPVWGLWSRTSKRKIKELLKYYLNEISKELKKKGLQIEYNRGTYNIPMVSINIAEKVRGYFRVSDSNKIASDSINLLDQMVIDEFTNEEL